MDVRVNEAGSSPMYLRNYRGYVAIGVSALVASSARRYWHNNT